MNLAPKDLLPSSSYLLPFPSSFLVLLFDIPTALSASLLRPLPDPNYLERLSGALKEDYKRLYSDPYRGGVEWAEVFLRRVLGLGYRQKVCCE